MKQLAIGEVAKYAGVQTSAIRYYESIGLLPVPKRVNGYRRYDPSVLKRLGLVQLLRQAGFGIRELQVLFSGLYRDSTASMEWQTLAVEKIAEMDVLIKQTQATKAWLVEALKRECKGIDECITITVDENGSGMSVTLSCENSSENSGASTRKSIKLMTMQPPHRP
jgi:MerR family transcriptional regulator, redox-sensitive transcriptional activator SoxR